MSLNFQVRSGTKIYRDKRDNPFIYFFGAARHDDVIGIDLRYKQQLLDKLASP